MFMVCRLNILKMALFSELNCRFNEIPIKIPRVFFLVEIDKLILMFMWKYKGYIIKKSIFKNSFFKKELANLSYCFQDLLLSYSN